MKKDNEGNFLLNSEEYQELRQEIYDELIIQLKSELKTHIHQGSNCQVCNTTIKLNHYVFSKHLLNSLMSLYELHIDFPERFSFHKDEIQMNWKKIANSIGKLKYWKLITDEQLPLGHYRILPEGRMFLESKISIPVDVYTFKDKRYRHPKGIKIVEKNFKYFSDKFIKTKKIIN